MASWAIQTTDLRGCIRHGGAERSSADDYDLLLDELPARAPAHGIIAAPNDEGDVPREVDPESRPLGLLRKVLASATACCDRGSDSLDASKRGKRIMGRGTW